MLNPRGIKLEVNGGEKKEIMWESDFGLEKEKG